MDGVRLAILNKRFEAICRKMANTLFRTGRSGALNTARDIYRVALDGAGNVDEAETRRLRATGAPASADALAQDAAE